MKRIAGVEWLLAALLAVALIVLAFVSSDQARRAAPKVETLSSYDAGPGGLRVWREVLEREGVRTDVALERPAFLGRDVATLVAAESAPEVRADLAQAQHYGRADDEALERWVRAGGHLVVVGTAHLSGLIGASAIRRGRGEVALAQPAAASVLTAGVRRVEYLARVSLAPRHSRALLKRGNDVLAASATFGRGRVTLVADGSAFTNNRIAHADNARFAYDVVQGMRPGKVAFDEWLHGYGAERSLWSALGAPLRAAAIILALAALLALWRAGLRLGQPIVLYTADTRTSAGYVGAMARLLLRAHARVYAIASLAEPLAGRQAASRRAGRESVALLAELQALRHETHPTDRDVLRAAALCATLRKDQDRHAGFERTPLGAIGRRPA